jgi:RNA polymerase sigma factor (sigma-70 family)
MFLTKDPRPDFWINGRDREQRPIDPALLGAAEDLWPQVLELVKNGLRDETLAAELLEQVVQELADSQRTGALSAELTHPRALLLTRFCQRLLNQIRRERRISYVGTVLGLETRYGPLASTTRDTQALHERILIAQLLALTEPDARRLFVLRLGDYRWAAIGRLLGATTGAVRERYRAALKRLQDRLSAGKGSKGRTAL